MYVYLSRPSACHYVGLCLFCVLNGLVYATLPSLTVNNKVI